MKKMIMTMDLRSGALRRRLTVRWEGEKAESSCGKESMEGVGVRGRMGVGVRMEGARCPGRSICSTCIRGCRCISGERYVLEAPAISGGGSRNGIGLDSIFKGIWMVRNAWALVCGFGL